MRGCKDCDNSTSGVCALHSEMNYYTVTIGGNSLESEVQRLKDAVSYILYIQGCYTTAETVRLALIAQRCRDVLKV